MKTKQNDTAIDITKILSKSQLRKAIMQSLFVPVRGRSLACMKVSKFDLGKYKPGSMVGQNLPAHCLSWVYAVWVESRKDRDGLYDQLMCYSIYENGPFAA